MVAYGQDSFPGGGSGPELSPQQNRGKRTATMRPNTGQKA